MAKGLAVWKSKWQNGARIAKLNGNGLVAHFSGKSAIAASKTKPTMHYFLRTRRKNLDLWRKKTIKTHGCIANLTKGCPIHMRSRRFQFLALSLAVALSAGCARTAPTDNLGPRPTPMKINDVRHFSFPVDGQWHQSDILVLYDDQMLIEPVGYSDGIAYGALDCRAGGQPLYVDGEQRLRFKHLAPLEFKCNTRKAEHHQGLVEVRVTKFADRRNKPQPAPSHAGM